MKKRALTFLAGMASVVVIGVILSLTTVRVEEDVVSSKKLDVYYPGTEELAPDEMRVVALGTGMPNARPKQAAACWLVELGNGDKFIFDLGLPFTLSMAPSVTAWNGMGSDLFSGATRIRTLGFPNMRQGQTSSSTSVSSPCLTSSRR